MDGPGTARWWAPAEPPRGFADLWAQELRSVAELPDLRARVRVQLTGAARVAEPARDHWTERLVLVVDELASNALRHGRPPVTARLGCRADDWLIAVTDAAPASPPAPAHGRDPGLGGFGLHMIAGLSRSHGWSASEVTKTVWAVLTAGPLAQPRRPPTRR